MSRYYRYCTYCQRGVNEGHTCSDREARINGPVEKIPAVTNRGGSLAGYEKGKTRGVRVKPLLPTH